ncbi:MULTISPECIES: hypothetical protein [Enterobacter cloacae complex]|uniref:Capsular biosynthesis protein n=1 Tax=Enterobacter cloacae TaxID=550 RepID=A0A7H8UAP6_ENTCL|nr:MULTISPECIES: hypothetical protein [Enterobacter cloacae complex]MDE4080989.1 hypothetical protein [Enterobacter pasteurii]QKZ96980.1 hypothetical protein HWQ14_04400 [Enterobacter cloacae]
MIAFLIEGHFYAYFFIRIVKALPERERKNVIFFSRDSDICNLIKSQLPYCQVMQIPMLKSVPEEKLFHHSRPLLGERLGKAIESSFEYVIGGGERKVCWHVLLSCFVFFNQFEPARISRFVMCSGCGIGAKAAKVVCELKSIPMQFVELSNLPNKIFVDPLGTNAHSQLAMTPEILERYPAVEETTHLAWMSRYRAFKAQPPRQAQGNILTNFINECSTDKILNTGAPYLFVPLQVSNDAQLWLYSRYKNEDVIRYALQLAQSSGYQVVVKLHPAEPQSEEVRHIVQLQKTLGFKLSRELTTDLIKQSEGVVTINSTVGLEGLLHYKPVIAIGDCFYKTFNQEMLKKYIHYYLFNGIDFFSNDRIDREKAIEFINR